MADLLGWAHRRLWQRLPRRLRRGAVERAAALLAPRPSRTASAGRQVIVAGVLSASSGLGQSARACRQALAALGENPRVVDVSGLFLARSEVVRADEDDSRPATGPGVLIAHVNAPLLPLALLRLGRAVLDGKVVVGYWAWELPAVLPSWRRGFSFVHEIWVPSKFVADAVRPHAEGRPVRVVPHPVALDAEGDPPPNDSARPFTVLVLFDMASGFTRKNPLGAIRAFRMAFGDDGGVRLIVKCQHSATYAKGRQELADAIAGASNIVLDERMLERSAVMSLVAACDVFLSLHRSEGFGLGLAEAMAAGRPVIATNWSGNVDFLGLEEGRPIGFTMVPASDPQGVYDYPDQLWAEPDLEEAAEAMVSLRRDRGLRQRLGMAARERVIRELGPADYGRALAACRAGFR
jgi:glycosyltransferase involved in cell wall biosynthesis